MIRKVFCTIFILLGGVGLARSASASQRASLQGVQLVTSAASARALIELSGPVRPLYFTLGHPDRAVIDLEDTAVLRPVRLPRAAGLVTAVRMGSRPGGVLRLVFTLRSAVTIHIAWRRRTPGAQLEVDLTERTLRAAATVRRAPVPIHVAHAPRRTGRAIIVAVDPGHGGVDPGTIGHYGTEEKNITLAIGRILARRIDAQRGMRAVLTRDSDIFLPLRARMRIARRDDADLFVSIHADDVSDRQIRGASVYILSVHGASSEAARILAARENAADLKGGIQLDDKSSTLASVLLNLSQTAAISDSMTAAQDVLGALRRSVPVCKHRVQQAAFMVLKSPDIPSMLVETDYLSDPTEELKLRQPWYQRRIADAVFRGIRAYFRDHPPAGTLFAQERRKRPGRLLARASRN